MAMAPPKKTRDLLKQQQAPYHQQRYHVTTVTRYLMVSVTSTLHFRDTLHFTITTTTTTTMTTPTTKPPPPPPPPPPRAQTRPPPLQEQTGLETQLRLASQVNIYIYIFFFGITNIYLQCVRYASHDDDNRRHAGPRRRKGAQTMRLAIVWALGTFFFFFFL